MFSEDDLLPVSSLQHLAFCERQWALIHLENIWMENRLTVEGGHMHDRAHDGEASETRDDVRVTRGLRVRSLRLGLSGQCDVVEFPRVSGGTPLLPFPIEYKRGKPKADRCDEVQLCAQAMCLEEMLGVEVPAGAMFYGKTRRRHDVAFDAGLRAETERLVRRLHELYAAGVTPRATYEKKCDSCSLYEACRPKTTGSTKRASDYVARSILEAASRESAP